MWDEFYLSLCCLNRMMLFPLSIVKIQILTTVMFLFDFHANFRYTQKRESIK